MAAQKNLIGFNLSLQFSGDPNVAADHARRINGRYHVLLGQTAKRALEYAQSEHFVGTTIIDRHVEEGDGNWWQTLTPQQMVDKIAAREGRSTLVRYVLNEPGIANSGLDVLDPERRKVEAARIEKFVTWCVKVLDLAAAIGERVIIGNLWAGTPHEYWIDNGHFDALIRALDRHHDLHLLGLHEGAPFMVAGKAAVTLAYDKMYDPANVLPGEEGTQNQWGAWEDPATLETDNAWMVGRCWRWGKRAKQIKCRVPRIVITEFTPARNDMQGAKALYHWMTQQFGVAIGRYMDGLPTLLNPYAHYFGGMDKIAKTFRRMLQWVGLFMPENVEGVCLYAYNFQNDEKQSWREFNIGDLLLILQELFDHPVPPASRQYDVVPPPDDDPEPEDPPVPQPKRLTPSVSLLNVRRSAPTGSVIVGKVSAGQTLTAASASEWDYVGKAGEWVRISAPVAGYVAADFLRVE